MGAGQTRHCACVVRNQSGSGVQVLRSPAPEFGIIFIEHGAERAIEASSSDATELHLAVRFSAEDVRALTVPDHAALLIRASAGKSVLRIWRPDKSIYETPSYIDAGVFAAEFQRMEAQDQETSQQASSCSMEAAATAAVAVEVGRHVADASDSMPAAEVASPRARLPRVLDDQLVASCAQQAADDVATSPTGIGEAGRGQVAASVRTQAADSCSVAEDRMAGQAPSECICPISHELFVDPVLAADGFTYERECIEEWWRRRGPRSPMTGQEVPSTTLTPNLAIRALAIEHRAFAASRHGAGESSADSDIGFYERHFVALAEMFAHLSQAEIHKVCSTLADEGLHDIDACVRQLLQLASPDGEAAVVSLAPVCCAAGHGDAELATAAALLDPTETIPDAWSVSEEALFGEMLQLNIPPVRARKAIEIGEAQDIEEAVIWLEKHQEDEDIDTPLEVLKEQETVQLALQVLRVATVPALHRIECLRALHKVLGRILADPGSARLRQLRLKNKKFHERIGRFPQALAVLRQIGFVQGEYWVSATQREPCLEFRLPVDSDNPTSQRFVRAYSLIDEVLRAPEEWLPALPEALPEVRSGLGQRASVQLGAGAPPEEGGDACLRREYMAELHERRVRDPRGFQESMRAAGKTPNRIVVDVRLPGSEELSARQLTSVASSSSAGPTPRYRRLSERFRGRREFSLQDIEAMRTEDAIAACPQYAQEYDRMQAQANSYGDLLTRMYDPQYLGRRALDATNVFRGQQQVPPLRWSQALSSIAEAHAQEMARGEMPFSHKGFNERVSRYPFPHLSAAENLAMNGGVSDAAGVAVDGWIKSPGHRKNLLGAFDLCGIGVARSAGGQFFFTQLFARTVGGALC